MQDVEASMSMANVKRMPSLNAVIVEESIVLHLEAKIFRYSYS